MTFKEYVISQRPLLVDGKLKIEADEMFGLHEECMKEIDWQKMLDEMPGLRSFVEALERKGKKF